MKKIIFICILVCSFFANYAQKWGDYTLIAVQNGTSTQLIDTTGAVFKTWTHTTATKTGYSAYLMPGGYLWRTVARSGNSFTGGPICGQVQKIDFQGNIVWDYIYSTTTYCTHHDICPLPNGNVLLIAYERKSATDVSNAGGTYSGEMWSEKIVEVEPTGATTGNIVWEWKLWDHLCQNVNAAKPNYVTSIVDNPQRININYNKQKDWIHMNGIDYNPILDQITVSSHNLNEIWVIDHSTTTAEAAGSTGGNSGKGGDILYRWGNPAAYSASGTKIINVGHDAHWIPEGAPSAGRLVVFNNKGQTTPSSKSTIDQIIPPLNGYNYNITQGTAYTPATFDSRIICSGYTTNMGSSQQLPNGNTLICVAGSGLVYEVNTAGTTIWSKTASGAVPKASRYHKCIINYPPPPIPIITENNNTLTSTAATTYQWYKNGQAITGATAQTYTPTESAIYVVRITDSNGCVYMYSKGFKHIHTTVNSNSALIENNFKIYPNPSSGTFNISFSAHMPSYFLTVYDVVGKSLFTLKDASEIDLNDMDTGVYFVIFEFSDGHKICKKINLIK